MKTPASFLAVILFAAALPLAAQQAAVEYNPVSCWRSDEMAVLSMGTSTDGNLRAFYRRAEATDWCWVDGTNAGLNSSVVMPKFEDGAIIEYYFTTVLRNQITARSPHIYRVKVSSQCDTNFTRKVPYLIFGCTSTKGAQPSAMGAGYSAGKLTTTEPPHPTPDTPTTSANGH